MKQVIIEIFGIPIHGYGLMIVIGFLLALTVISSIARKRGLPDVMYDLGMVMLLSGILGGRTFYYFENYTDDFSKEPFWAFFKIWEGGLVFYGGAIGGSIGALAFLRLKKLPFAPILDVAAVGVPLGMAFGRLGCFLNGCCFGRLCGDEFAAGMRFPANAAPYKHQVTHGWIEAGDAMFPVHPVQLYQAGHDSFLFLFLWWYVASGRAPRGAGMPVLWMLYGIGRFCLEGLRGDNPMTMSGLTISQNVSIAAVVIFGGMVIWCYWTHLATAKGAEKNCQKVG